MSTTFHITNTNVSNSSMSPTNDASPEAQAVLINNTIVAAGMWLNSFVKGQGSIEITVNFGAPIATVNGASLSNIITGSFAVNGISHPLRQDSALYEMQVGTDVNASASDAVINVRADPDFYYWFDPTLTSSSDIPSNKTDGFRIMLHELLHIIGINGWVCYGGTGSDYSTYDQYVVTQNGRSFFTGSNAVKAFGGFVPITNAHLGDEASINAGVLTGNQTVMSIGSVPNGVRISLDPVVIGVLRDLGYTVRDTQAVYSGEDGKIDTATIHGSLTEYAVTHTLDLSWLTHTNQSDYAYMLQSIERLKFTDGNLALDFDGHAGQVVKMLGAVFGKIAIANKQWIGVGLSLLDNGVSYEQLGASAMQYLGKINHADIVAQLWNNLTGTMPTAQQAAPIVQFLQDGMGVGTLCALAADTSINATNIGLIGLADTGIAFL